MPYYRPSSHHVKVNRENMKYLGEGACGKVYHDSHIIWKKYFYRTEYQDRISPPIFRLLQSIQNPHLIELYDLYYRCYKPAVFPFYPDAYTAKYYPDHSVNILSEPKDYLIENFHELDQLFERLSRENVLVTDVTSGNSILGREGIVIIDPDHFRFSNLPKEKTMLENKRALLFLIYELCNHALASMRLSPDWDGRSPLQRAPAEISLFELTSQTDIAKKLSQKLSSVSRPLDYFVR